MPIQVNCSCGKSVSVKDEWAGRKARCSGCQQIVVVPTPKKKPAVEDDVVTCDPVDDDVVTCEPVEEKKTSFRAALEQGKAAKKRPKLGDDEDEEDDRPRRSRRDRDDEEDDDRPRSRRARDEDDDYDDRPRSRRDRDRDEKPRPVKPKKRTRTTSSGGGSSSTAMAGIFGGIGMMVLAIAWFVAGIIWMDRIFFYPPILFVLGVIAFIKGLMGGD